MPTKVRGETIGELVRSYRMLRGVSQLDLGRAIGWGQGHISTLEANSSEPTLESLRKIAKALKVSIHQLIPESW